MEDVLTLTNDAAVIIIDKMNYKDTRRWCQTNHQFRQKCNLNYWLNQIRVEFDLTPEQLSDLTSHKPDDVTLAVYYKWLKTWFAKMSVRNFEEAVENGLLPVVKLYYYKGIESDNSSRDFRSAAARGHLATAQWLHSLGDVDIHAFEDLAFQLAAKGGHLETAKWLYGLGGIDIHAGNDYAFRMAAEYGHLATAQWLYSLGDVNIHYYNDKTFRMAAARGHLAVTQWLHVLGGVNIHADNDFAFRMAAMDGHLEMAQWLYSLDGIDINTVRRTSRDASIDKHKEVVEWLDSL